MRFLRDAVITILLLAIVAVTAAVVVVRRGGLAASDEPGRLERAVASRLVRLAIPADADRQQSPLGGQADVWRQAREHYLDHCAVCHGRDAKGHTDMGANMYPKVPDLTSAQVQGRSDGALFYIIQNGIRWTGMPAWKKEHTPEDTWKLVAFIRKAPTLTEADMKIEEPVPTTGRKTCEGSAAPSTSSLTTNADTAAVARASTTAAQSALHGRRRDTDQRMKLPGSASDPLWFKDAIIYELHVEGFYDSTGDGVGDFRGLAEQLDYLQNLGVTCLWLLPFLASPLRDDGYDVSDYRNIHPNYGTLEDFMAFMEAAHARRMQVIMELAINHTSDQHPWFERARRAAPGTEEREFYVWSDSNQRFADARVILHDSKLGNWTWDPEANAHYWHRFSHHEPDLNYDNPAVLRRDARGDGFLARDGRRRLELACRPLSGGARGHHL